MAWTGQNFSVGQILTAAQMNNVQADISALAAGDVGAPEIVRAAIKSTIDVTHTGSLGAGLNVDISIDAYCFFPMIYGGGGGIEVWGNSVDGASGDNARLRMHNGLGTTQNYAVDYRFIQS